MRSTIIIASTAILIAGCANPIQQAVNNRKQQVELAMGDFRLDNLRCNQLTGETQEQANARGPYQLPAHVSEMHQCQNQAMTKLSGVMTYRAEWMALNVKRLSLADEVRAKKKTRQMAAAELEQAMAAAMQNEDAAFRSQVNSLNSSYMAQQQNRANAWAAVGKQLSAQNQDNGQKNNVTCTNTGGFVNCHQY